MRHHLICVHRTVPPLKKIRRTREERRKINTIGMKSSGNDENSNDEHFTSEEAI